jgi:hypothetical protein
VNEKKKRELALWGERGFRFVEEGESVALKLIFEQREEGLAVGAGVQTLSAAAGKNGRPHSLVLHGVI